MRSSLSLAVFLLLAGAAEAQDLNVITAVEVRTDGTSVVVTVKGSKPPNFTTFSMADPARFVIDLSEAKFQGVPEDLRVDDGVIRVVKNLAYGSGATAIARVMIAFSLDVEPPDVQTDGTSLAVRVSKPAGTAVAAAAARPTGAAAPAAASGGAATAKATGTGAETAGSAAAVAAAATAKAAADESARQEALAREQREVEAREQARLTAEASAKEREAQAKLEADARAREAEKVAAEQAAAEAKARAAAAARSDEIKAKAAAEQSVQPQKPAVPAAVVAAAAVPTSKAAPKPTPEELAASAEAEREARAQAKADARAKREVELALAAQQASEAKARAAAQAPVPVPVASPARPTKLKAVGFKQFPTVSRVFVKTSVTPRFTITDVGDDVVRLEVENTRASRRNDTRPLDTSFFPSAVALITPSKQGTSYVVDIKLKKRVPYQQKVEGDVLAIDFERPAVEAASGEPAAPGAVPASVAGGASGEPIDNQQGMIIAPEEKAEAADPAESEVETVPAPKQ